MGIWIDAGQVSVEQGSTLVVGTGTTFGVSVAPGNIIYIDGGLRAYQVESLDPDSPNTKLILAKPFAEDSVVNGSYEIVPFLGDRTPVAVNLLKQISFLTAGQTDVIETVGAPDPTIAATNVTGKLIAFDATNRAYYYTQDGAWNGPVSLGGADGADAGFKIVFSNLTATNADPGTGNFRLNSGTLSTVTQFALDDASADLGNPDISAYVASWVASTSAVKGTIIVRDVAQPNVFATFALNSIADQTGYTQLNVTHIASHGAFADGHSFSVAFIRNGDKGDTGAAGVNAGFLITLDRDTNTMADPTTGKMKFDGATFAATNNIAIDDTSADPGNPSIAALVGIWARSTNAKKGQIRIAKVGAGGNFVSFDIVSVIAKTGWSQVGVALVAAGGTLATGDICSVTFAQAGDAGTNGSNGLSAWTPVYAIATDGDRRVQQVVDWTGGTAGTKPATGKYVGATGFVDNIADGIDIRGQMGLQGDTGTNFDPDARGLFSERSTYDAQGEGYCFLSIDGDGASVTTAVLFFKNSATSGDWSAATPFQGPPGDPGTTDYNALSNKPTLGTVAPLDVDTDGTLAANSDGKVASQKATKTALATKLNASAVDIDGTMAANSASRVPAQSAVVAYVATKIAALVDSSPATLDTFKELADALGDDPNFATTMMNALAARAQGPVSSIDGNIALFNGTTGKVIKDSGIAPSTDGTLASNSDAKLPTEKAVKAYVDGKAPATLSYYDLPEIASPAAPAASTLRLYAKADGSLYIKDPSGVETQFSLPFATGSFAPQFTFATPGNLSISYANQEGHWTRLGDLIFMSISLRLTPTFSTASGTARIVNLPFTFNNLADDTNGQPWSGSMVITPLTGMSGWLSLLANTVDGAAYIALQGSNAGALANIDASKITSGTQLRIGIFLTFRAP